MTKTFMLAIFFEAVSFKIFETFIMIDLHFYASFDMLSRLLMLGR